MIELIPNFHPGIVGLEMFSPASDQWKQAHSRARCTFYALVLSRVIRDLKG